MTALGECAWTDRALVGPAVLVEGSSSGKGQHGTQKLLTNQPAHPSTSTAWLVLSERLPDGRWVECERPGSLPDGAHLLAPDFAWEYAGGERVRCWISSAEAERQGRKAPC